MVLRTQLWGQDPQTAADAPRWRAINGLNVAVEKGIDREALERFGHVLSADEPDAAFGFGGAQLVQRLDGGGYVAGSDFRKDGQAAGF